MCFFFFFATYIYKENEPKNEEFFVFANNNNSAGKPLFTYIKHIFTPLCAREFANLISALLNDISTKNFNVLENLFSDNMWCKDSKFMNEVHNQL